MLFWGDVGTGKPYLAACVANALIEREVSVTTNLPLQTINNPTDVMHKKIYDRLKNCVPVQFTGESFRKDIGNQKKEEFRQILLNAQESF